MNISYILKFHSMTLFFMSKRLLKKNFTNISIYSDLTKTLEILLEFAQAFELNHLITNVLLLLMPL